MEVPMISTGNTKSQVQSVLPWFIAYNIAYKQKEMLNFNKIE